MGSGYLVAGTKARIEGEEYILRRRVDSLWQFENPKTGLFKTYDEQDLHRLVAEGRLLLVSDGTVRKILRSAPELPPRDEEIARIRRAYVEAVKELPTTYSAFDAAIREVWNRIKQPVPAPSFTTVYRWKLRYLNAGRDIRALADNSKAKGPRGPRHPELTPFCEQAIEQFYMQRFGNTIERTLERARALVTEENNHRLTNDKLELPTRRMLKYLIDRIPEFDKYVARHGYVAARNRFRSVKGHIVTNRPLERAEIDHTVLDLIVVDDRTGLQLGRPTITACIDAHTRMVLGLYVGFRDPSYYAVQRCLRHCIMPKLNLTREFPSLVNEWPSYGIMENLVCDNGLEFHGTSLEKACEKLGINIMTAPRKQPQTKGIIERFLGTLNSSIAHQAPGTTFSNIIRRGDYNPAKEACVPLSALRHAIWKWIVDVYHQRPHSSLGVKPSAMWHSSAKLEEIQLPDDATGPLDVHLGRAVVNVTLTHEGVRFAGLRYNSQELERLRKLHGTNLKVELRVNDDDLGSLWVLYPESNQLLQAYALDPYAKGLTIRQHQVYKARKAENPDAKPDIQGLIEAREKIERILKQVVVEKPEKLGTNYAAYVERPTVLEAAPENGEQSLTKLPGPNISEPTTGWETAEPSNTTGEQEEEIFGLSELPKKFTPILRRGYDNE